MTEPGTEIAPPTTQPVLTKEQKREEIKKRREAAMAKIMRRCTSRIAEDCVKKAPLNTFPNHGKGEKGTVCRACKNEMSKRRRRRDTVARFRHYIVSRLRSEWDDDLVPSDIYPNLEKYLGYKLATLKKHLREDLKEREGITLVKSFELGYHLDHIKPHKSFNQKEVGDEQFQACWAVKNLWMIPAEMNLRKGAKEDFLDSIDK